MAFNVPSSLQWISFIVNPEAKVNITWSEGKIQQTAQYAVTKCYWGYLKDELRVPTAPAGAQVKRKVILSEKKLMPLGVTNIFIASEYLDPSFKGGPLDDYHLHVLAKKAEGWITMQLNDCFQYGQMSSGEATATKMRRWVVYHPIASPAIFQHRFTGILAENIAKDVITEGSKFLSKEHAAKLQSDLGMFSFAIEVAKSAFGHYLHDFLDVEGVSLATKRWETAKKSNAPTDKTAVAIQQKKAEEKVTKNTAFATMILTAAGIDPNDKKATTTAAIEYLKRLKPLDDNNLFLLAVQLEEIERAGRQNEDTLAWQETRLKEQIEAAEKEFKLIEAMSDSSFLSIESKEVKDARKKMADEVANLKAMVKKINIFNGNILADGDTITLANVGATAIRNGLDPESAVVTEEFGQPREKTRSDSEATKASGPVDYPPYFKKAGQAVGHNLPGAVQAARRQSVK